MTKTENFALNQWDAVDPIRREDFNADNAALDAALNAIKNAAEEDVRSLGETVAALADTVEGRKIAVGTYAGNDGTQTINVGFTPKVVWVCNQRINVPDGYLCGMAITGGNSTNSGTNTLLTIVENGFQTIFVAGSSLNLSTYTYNYLAVA